MTVMVLLTLLTLQAHIVSLRKTLSHLRVPTASCFRPSTRTQDAGRRTQDAGRTGRTGRTGEELSLRLTDVQTLQDLKQELDLYRGFYNERRPHRALGGATPREFLRAAPRAAQ